MVVAGGVGIGANTNIGGNLNVGNLTKSSTTKIYNNLQILNDVGSGNTSMIKLLSDGDNNYIQSWYNTSSRPFVFSRYWITPSMYLDTTSNRLGINKSNPTTILDVYGTANISGITNITNTTQSSNISTGALVVSGGFGIGSDVNIGGNLNMNGNQIQNVASITGYNNKLAIPNYSYLLLQGYGENISTTAQGAYFGWNSAGGGGRTDFICNRGTSNPGGGGFNFFIQDSSGSANVINPLASISGTGLLTIPSIEVDTDLTVNGNTYLNSLDVSGNLTVNGNVNISGNLVYSCQILTDNVDNVNITNTTTLLDFSPSSLTTINMDVSGATIGQLKIISRISSGGDDINIQLVSPGNILNNNNNINTITFSQSGNSITLMYVGTDNWTIISQNNVSLSNT